MRSIPAIDVPIENIKKHFFELGRIGNLGPTPEDGFLRSSWSDEESAAMGYIRLEGESKGLIASNDGIGNLYLTTSREGGKVIQAGSHLDTVPKGGLYDGGAGIVAGLEAILALREYWSSMNCDLQLVVWRGEESATYGSVCKGSRAAYGLNDPKILMNKFQGKSLEEAINSQGFDPSYIRQCQPALAQWQINSITAYIELHIEQARKLDIARKQIGIVTSMRGAARYRIVVTGESAHSGGTPMGSAFRRDANLAIAYMQVELDRLGQQWLEQGDDLVQTVGVVNIDPDFNMLDPRVYENSYTKVSPFGYFTLDIRSSQAATLAAYIQDALRLILDTGSKFRVAVEIIEMNKLSPTVTLDTGLQTLLAESCIELGYSCEPLPSGALHDAAIVASQLRSDRSQIPVGLVFIPCRDGISHNPREYASPTDIQRGSLVLARTLWKLANG